jgi:hypothetical protein
MGTKGPITMIATNSPMDLQPLRLGSAHGTKLALFVKQSQILAGFDASITRYNIQ